MGCGVTITATEQGDALLADRVELTAHPLQRIGAYALAALAEVDSVSVVSAGRLESVAALMTDHAVAAATGPDSKSPEGFWLKCSLSFFPNSPMNHPSNGKKAPSVVADAVRKWRGRPSSARDPGAPCVLCGRPGVGFYGKLDVPLAESDAYRNNTPRGHQGMALCWPCLCCFYALPYASQLSGGPGMALHSWDEEFLAWTVAEQVDRNRREILVGRGVPRQPPSREVLALRALREYRDELNAGVELLVYSNNNRGQVLDVHVMDQPLAEWLRRTSQSPVARAGYSALLRAHKTADRPGVVALARNAFRDPGRIVATASGWLGRRASAGRLPVGTSELVTLCMSYVDEVMGMDQENLAEIRATADRVGQLLGEGTAGQFNKFYAAFRKPALLRGWLRRQAADWALHGPQVTGTGASVPGPSLVSARAYELLFDPGLDSQAWFHRELFLFAVLEKLHQLDWRPHDADQAAKELAEDEEDAVEDEDLVEGRVTR